jgi:hypothetical protein
MIYPVIDFLTLDCRTKPDVLRNLSSAEKVGISAHESISTRWPLRENLIDVAIGTEHYLEKSTNIRLRDVDVK